jgi:hypothetical protein
MNFMGPLAVLGVIASVVTTGCADRTTLPVADAGTSSTSSSSSDSGQDLDEGESGSSTSTSENGTTDTSTTDTGSEDTLGFVPMTNEFGEHCQCDTFAQDCPEGEKCVPYSSGGDTWDCVKCVPIVGDQATGEPCSYGGLIESTDDCDAESFCFTEEAEGICRAFCTGTYDNPTCDPGTACLITNHGDITLCVPTCDPLVQDCDEGFACYWANWGFVCLSSEQGNIPTGEPCAELNDCAPGNLCASSEVLACDGESCCAAYCDLNNPVCTTMGTECVAFFENDMAPAGLEHMGICLTP